MLAELPLPVYVTTDYDSNMMEALKTQPMREPKRELCRWWGDSRDQPSIFDSSYEPTVANPVVFHLHGHMDTPESMLVTEDDYLDYVAVSRERKGHPIPDSAGFYRILASFPRLSTRRPRVSRFASQSADCADEQSLQKACLGPSFTECPRAPTRWRGCKGNEHTWPPTARERL